MTTHRLLARQLRKLLGKDAEIPEEWQPLLEVVSTTYQQADLDRLMLERSLHLSSDELLRATSDVRALLSALPDLTVRLSSDGRLLEVLSHGTMLTACEAPVGQPLQVVFDPKCHEAIAQALEEARRSQAPVTVMADFECSGSPDRAHEVELRLCCALDGEYLAILRDVTDVVRNKREAEKSQALLQGTLDSTDEGILVVDTTGNVVVFNERLLEIFGLPSETDAHDLVRQLVSRVQSDALRHEHLLSELSRVAGDATAQRNFTFELKSGRSVYCQLRPQSIRPSISGQLWCFRDVSERTRAEQRIRQQALRDPLTGLGNRSFFNQQLPEIVEAARAEQSTLALLAIDLDRFKSINDSLGHGAGDDLLRQVSRKLQRNVRGGDVLSRLGGDEFTVIVRRLREPSDAAVVAGNLLEAISGNYQINGQRVYVSGSVGVASFPEDAADASELVQRADAALYQAKEKGRDQVCLSHAEQSEGTFNALTLENEMRVAIDRRQFAVHYQPQIDMRSGEMVGVEALVRWPRPDGSMLSPAHFIPLAEESGLIVPLGYWVLEEAIRGTAKLRQRHPELRVSVNLSPRQLRDERLVENVEALLRVHPVRRKNLVLELTESGILPNPDQARRVLNSFRNLGVRVALDDFGTGQSSLSHLSQLQIDIVKIDRSFVKDCWSQEARGAIVSAVLAICRARKLSVVAEGIETEAEEGFLLAQNCIFGQGFRYHKPAPIEVIEEFVAQRGAVGYQPEDLDEASVDAAN